MCCYKSRHSDFDLDKVWLTVCMRQFILKVLEGVEVRTPGQSDAEKPFFLYLALIHRGIIMLKQGRDKHLLLPQSWTCTVVI